MENYKQHAKNAGCADDVMSWIEGPLSAWVKKKGENQQEIEHIIDFLASDDRPKRLTYLSYEAAVEKAEKWVEALAKKASEIKEGPEDTKTVLDFGDGFKIVQLVGENSYQYEGAMMHHCVASYFGRNSEIYSLRDPNNIPHCTIENGAQIKGKCSLYVSPKYVDYVVRFLESKGMKMRETEYENLGYVKISSEEKKFIVDHFGNSAKFYKDCFFFINGELVEHKNA